MTIAEIEIRPGMPAQRDPETLELLYRSAFPPVVRFVRKMNGSPDQATDIFHDALILYTEKKEAGTLHLHSSPEAYILGIAKHLWVRKFKIDRSLVSLSDSEPTITIPADFFPAVNTLRLLAFLERTGKKCLDLLHSFYFERQNLSGLTRSLNYPNEHAASVQKYKCIEKLRDLVKEKSATYEDFTD